MYALKTFFIAQVKSYKAMKQISVQLAETVSVQVILCSIIFLIDGQPIVKLLSGRELPVKCFQSHGEKFILHVTANTRGLIQPANS